MQCHAVDSTPIASVDRIGLRIKYSTIKSNTDTTYELGDRFSVLDVVALLVTGCMCR